MRKPGFATVILLLVSFTDVPVRAQGYQAEYIDIGGVNLNYYRVTTFGSDYKSLLIGATAGDWKCENRRRRQRLAISVEDAGRLHYGIVGLKAKALNSNDPGSWRCMQPHVVRSRAPSQIPPPLPT